MQLDQGFVNHVLNSIEDLELPLLVWGITDGALSEDEVLQVIRDAQDTHKHAPIDVDEEDILDELHEQALIFKIPATLPRRYRTRFAEALRLTSHLRQLFPPYGRTSPAEQPSNWWCQGPQLVADFRLHTASRRYPTRDIPVEAVLSELRQSQQWGSVQDRLATALIGERDLSAFQVAATKGILQSLTSPHSTGVIVGAGTGSGKTLAFYLPAFSLMGSAAQPGGKARVHTLALYPRTELLRDQLREALVNSRSVEQALLSENRRPLRIGALYKDTLRTAKSLDNPGMGERAWKRRSDGFICPYLTCPTCTVGDLLWANSDRNSDSEQLTCLNCASRIPSGRLGLTRQSLSRTPPDLLFTTTEMLNRHSTNPYLGRLLGWIGKDKPSLVLLDEVHTYTGPHGAQVALLLRRWQHAVGKRVTFVGLSATLKNAMPFFAELTGLTYDAVEYVEPHPSHMQEEGREYAIVLRGDPVSGASLLSTSIQTAMLFGRVLDPQSDPRLYGSTGFLFTDDLDVTNRFYDNLREAEGNVASRIGRKAVLAGLRSPDLPHHDARYQDGQSWDLMDKIGHRLDGNLHTGQLVVGRTSSQDAGIDLNADLTVATASLEVGFNDPRVGLVLQHKSPHDAAAFLQRKGRAGRQRGTRPITIVTLSDYGRDRLSYQGYEALFAPELSARNLPIRNRYVLKIQASQALLDWLGRDLQRAHPGQNLRTLLTAPYEQQSPPDASARTWVLDRLGALLADQRIQDRLARHLQTSLQIDADEAQAVLWEQPRSLMLAVIPTALRRLLSHWRALREDPGATAGALLPEFITRTLFEPLNVPEVELDLPFAATGDDERLPIAKALREAVPGRVSRRYGYQHKSHRTWLPVPAEGDVLELTRDLVPQYRIEGTWYPPAQAPEGLVVLRPYQVRLSEPGPEIEDRSQGAPRWVTQIVTPSSNPTMEAQAVNLSGWKARVLTIGFYSHAAGNPVEVRRMSYGAECDIARNNPISKERRSIRYTFEGKRAALGFSLAVDGVGVSIKQLDLTLPLVQQYLASPQWRSQAFFRTVAEDYQLAKITNIFQRNWLALIYITTFSLEGVTGKSMPAQTHTSLADGSWRDELATILGVLYRDESATESQATTRLVNDLMELSRNPDVIAALNRAGELLVVEDVAARTHALARRAYRDTFAAALLAAALKACPDAQEGDLIVDVLPSTTSEGSDTIWLTETSIGGLGVIEQLIRAYAADPRRFWSLVGGALRPNEFEYTDSTVTRLLKDVVEERPHGRAALAMARVRAAGSAGEADQALRELRAAWTDLDGAPRHSAVATVSTRLLRPGSNQGTDAACLELLNKWTLLEEQLGFEVDARVIAYAVGSGHLQVSQQPLRADQAFSMMWPRGAQARSHHLEYYQPYVAPEQPVFLDRRLISIAHDDQLPRIDVTQAEWQKQYQQLLAEEGAVDLVCPVTERSALSSALAQVPALPIDRGYLRIYGEIENLVRESSELVVRVELQEVEQ
ncbi:DEAD/DEAH box helicase [Microbispora rosea]|uniref:DEAD/DEAH box helicase n=1 Tax=Microbispora rosea TaxID=58117 RepID=A0A1N7HHS6_9ACTN|nr:protein DpdJ [Microbispora rosea]GIH51963.1 hypothetical protein Mro03_71420 [Microbispora rosea subsp. rosea]SIS24426.1 DEAD/DEAH box helicase [Microbispora rosea]